MNKIKLFGIPFDFGQDNYGVRFAYSYLKAQGLADILSEISPVDPVKTLQMPFKQKADAGALIKNKKFCSEINHGISDAVAGLDLRTSFLLNVGGDHGLGLGTVHGLLRQNPETVVVWADAHGDINTPESSLSKNFHGMPLSFLLGIARDKDFGWLTHKLLPKNLIFFGPRDLDPEEERIIEDLQIQYFSSKEINLFGTQELMEMALHRADPFGTKPIHLSLDVDLFDRRDIKATGTIVAEGPRLEEIFLLGGLLAETGRLRSMDLVEFNPLIGSREEVEASGEVILTFLRTTLKQLFSYPPQSAPYVPMYLSLEDVI